MKKELLEAIRQRAEADAQTMKEPEFWLFIVAVGTFIAVVFQ